MIEFTFNDEVIGITSIEELGQALDRFDLEPQFELWVFVPDGPSLCMLRNGTHAWLMYLRENGDSGFNSVGDMQLAGQESFTLFNGQVDEYPLAWCIDVEQCYKSIAYFYVNEGARPDWVCWQEST